MVNVLLQIIFNVSLYEAGFSLVHLDLGLLYYI